MKIERIPTSAFSQRRRMHASIFLAYLCRSLYDGVRVTLQWRVALPFVLQMLAFLPTSALLVVLTRFSVHGTKHLGSVKSAIFACNHSGELDPIVVTTAVLPRLFTPLFYVGAPDREFTHTFFGWRRHIYRSWFFRVWGMYPIVRGTQEYAQSLAAHESILTAGYSLCIFPEGRVSVTGELREGKGGVGYLHAATGIPIIPVYIAGTAKHTSPGLFSGRKRISVHFGPPIQIASTLEVDECKRIANRVMEAIAEIRQTASSA